MYLSEGFNSVSEVDNFRTKPPLHARAFQFAHAHRDDWGRVRDEAEGPSHKSIFIVKRRHFKVRSKKGKVRTGLFKKFPKLTQKYSYIYTIIYTCSTHTHTRKTHIDRLHTNA
jgi:hypothetical protein